MYVQCKKRLHPYQSHVYWWIQIFQFLQRVTQNLASSFNLFGVLREDQLFLAASEKNFEEVFLCPCSTSCPHSQEPCLLTVQNFANNFWIRSAKEHLCKIIRIFKEFLHLCMVQVAPIHQIHVYWQITTSWRICEKVTPGTFLWNYFKIWPAISKTIF